MKWYYQSHGKTHGPVSIDELNQLMRAGTLSLADLVYREGDVRWRVLIEIPDIDKRSGSSGVLRDHVELPKDTVLEDLHWVVLVKSQTEKTTSFAQDGPFHLDEIRERLQSGRLQYSDYAWKPGFDGWKRIGSLEEFDRRKDIQESKPVIKPPDVKPPDVKPPAKPKNPWLESEPTPAEAKGDDLVADSGVKPLKTKKTRPVLPPERPQGADVSKVPKLEKSEGPKVGPPARIPEARAKIPFHSDSRNRREEPRVSPNIAGRSKGEGFQDLLNIVRSAGHLTKRLPSLSFPEPMRKLAILVCALGLTYLGAQWMSDDPGGGEFASEGAGDVADFSATDSSPSLSSDLTFEESSAESEPLADRRKDSASEVPAKSPVIEGRKSRQTVTKPIKKAKRKVRIQVGKASFLRLKPIGVEQLDIESDLPVGTKIRIVFEGRTGKLIGAPGFYGEISRLQGRSGVTTLNYKKLKIPMGTYSLSVRGGRLKARSKSLSVGNTRSLKTKINKERKRWAYVRNREKQKLYYQLRDFDRLLKRYTQKKLGRSRTLTELRKFKRDEVSKAKSGMIRDLAFPQKWRRLREYVQRAETLVKQRRNLRGTASDPAAKLRAEVRALRREAGYLSVY